MLATAGAALGLGALGYGVGRAGDWASGGLKEAGYEGAGKAVGTLGRAGEYAGYGAALGTIVPGVGTAVGAGVGALAGGAVGAYEQYADPNKGFLSNMGDFAGWAGKKVGNAALNVGTLGMVGLDEQGNLGKGSTIKALEGARDFLGLGSSEKLPSNFSYKETGQERIQGETKDGKYYLNNKEVSREDYAAAAKRADASLAPARAELKQQMQGQRGAQIAQSSAANEGLRAQAARPQVMVPPQPAAAPGSGASGAGAMVLPRGSIRPTESALERYTARGSNFY